MDVRFKDQKLDRLETDLSQEPGEVEGVTKLEAFTRMANSIQRQLVRITY
jgi:hypothetical protein